MYEGTYQAAIARAKRTLIKASFEWSVTRGRYHPFANTQTTTQGVRVTRVGCSSTIALHAWGYTYEPREVSQALETKAIETLRAAGLPFDDRGYLECRY